MTNSTSHAVAINAQSEYGRSASNVKPIQVERLPRSDPRLRFQPRQRLTREAEPRTSVIGIAITKTKPSIDSVYAAFNSDAKAANADSRSPSGTNSVDIEVTARRYNRRPLSRSTLRTGGRNEAMIVTALGRAESAEACCRPAAVGSAAPSYLRL